jgi:DNA-binding winged helix-turn-helix (wHTH) protein
MPLPTYRFGDFELDVPRYELRRNGRVQKLERIPMKLLIFLLEKRGSVASRQEIVDHLWGGDVFIDTEHGINTAIRKIRQILRDDPDKPRFVLTITGKGTVLSDRSPRRPCCSSYPSKI